MALPLHSGSEGISLMELTRLAAMAGGAVAGAAAGWFCKRNAIFALVAFMMGIMGGIWIGTGMGRLFYVSADGVDCYVNAGFSCLWRVLLASLAGSVPAAFVIAAVISFLALRHMHPRPPRLRTGLTAMFCGVAGGILTGVVVALL